jgi:hypothetical protein
MEGAADGHDGWVDRIQKDLLEHPAIGIFATTDDWTAFVSGAGMEISGLCLMPPLRRLINVTPQSSKMTAIDD